MAMAKLTEDQIKNETINRKSLAKRFVDEDDVTIQSLSVAFSRPAYVIRDLIIFEIGEEKYEKVIKDKQRKRLNGYKKNSDPNSAPHHRLTEEEKREALKLYKTCKWSIADLKDRYDVNYAVMSNLISKSISEEDRERITNTLRRNKRVASNVEKVNKAVKSETKAKEEKKDIWAGINRIDTKQSLVCGMIGGRHDMPVNLYIFQSLAPAMIHDYPTQEKIVREFLAKHPTKSLEIYVTGLQTVLGSVTSVCAQNRVNLALRHYSTTNDTYRRQVVLEFPENKGEEIPDILVDISKHTSVTYMCNISPTEIVKRNECYGLNVARKQSAQGRVMFGEFYIAATLEDILECYKYAMITNLKKNVEMDNYLDFQIRYFNKFPQSVEYIVFSYSNCPAGNQKYLHFSE